MKSIQARLQSRIKLRSKWITYMEGQRKEALHDKDYDYKRKCDMELFALREDQVLDKQIISNFYWGRHGV